MKKLLIFIVGMIITCALLAVSTEGYFTPFSWNGLVLQAAVSVCFGTGLILGERRQAKFLGY